MMVWGACAGPTPSVVPEPSAAPSVEQPAVIAAPVELVVAEPVALAPVESGDIWRFTTLVTEGPKGLIGANGYYELVLDGDKATVRKIGVRGTPQLPAERVMEGSGTLVLAQEPSWPAARSGTVTVTLASAKAKTPISLTVWVLDDRLYGWWTQPSGKADAGETGRALGLLQGVRGRGEPVDLVDGEQAPCAVCYQAFFRCEGAGLGACNSSNTAIDACEQRMRSAKKRATALPLGCGDRMKK